MPIIVNNEEFQLYQIQGYNGRDEVVKRMRNSYEELNNRFWSKGKPVIFRIAKRYIKITKDGRKEGKPYIFIKWQEAVKTKSGNSTVIYCETVVTEANGVKRYEPRGRAFRRKEVLGENDAELAIFYHCISSVTSSGNSIYLEDLDKEEEVVAASRKEMAAVDYYLYVEDSPLFDDRDKLVNIAYRWGISGAEGLSDATLRNRLSAKLKTVNPATEPELTIKEFISAIKEDSPLGDALMIVQRAIDKHAIEYKDYQWYVITATKSVKLFAVPPHNDLHSKRELAYFLLRSPDKYEMVRSMSGYMAEEKEEEERLQREAHIYTKEELEDMEWKQLQRVSVGLDVFDRTNKKPEVIDKILAAQAIED